MNTVGLFHCLCLSGALFVLGLLGLILSRRHLVKALISLEIMLLSVHVLFVSFSALYHGVHGQVISLFILAVAAAEAAIGLALLVAFYRQKKSMMTHRLTHLKDQSQ